MLTPPSQSVRTLWAHSAKTLGQFSAWCVSTVAPSLSPGRPAGRLPAASRRFPRLPRHRKSPPGAPSRPLAQVLFGSSVALLCRRLTCRSGFLAGVEESPSTWSTQVWKQRLASVRRKADTARRTQVQTGGAWGKLCDRVSGYCIGHAGAMSLSGGTKRATSVNIPLLRLQEIYVSRNRARTQVLLQAQKLHAYGSGTFGAFWPCLFLPPLPRAVTSSLKRPTWACLSRCGGGLNGCNVPQQEHIA